jgi:hypothetical protein
MEWRGGNRKKTGKYTMGGNVSREGWGRKGEWDETEEWKGCREGKGNVLSSLV